MPNEFLNPSFLFIVVVVNVVILQFSCCVSTEEFETVDVDITKLSKLEHGTELVFLENDYKEKTAYHLEDFFWTGSGDGSDGESQVHWISEIPITEYKTKTVLSTIYIETPSTHINQTLPVQTTNCPFNCEVPLTPTEEIVPTPTYDIFYGNTTEESTSDADRHFWLVTVLKSEGKSLVITDLKNSLAKLYKIAFQRQQEHHLGISSRAKRETTDPDKPVNVYIHNVAKSPINGEEKIEVLYHVSVSGQPVAATTAAADMHLVSDEEVTNELGYPFIIKAEPYLKVSDPQYLASSNNTWVFIGVALTILFVLLLLVALLTLALSKHSKTQMGLPNKKQVFHQDINAGHTNTAFASTGSEKREYESGRRRESSTYINFRSQPSNQTLKSGVFLTRPQNPTSSSSSFSASSLDTSPLMIVKKKQPTPPRKSNITRPKAALNKTTPLRPERETSLVLDSDSSSDKSRRDSSDTILIKNCDPGVVSPKSYLSMPSVKSFPRGNIPEPLSKVLKPVSVLHLDIADDDDLEHSIPRNKKYDPVLTRHGSLSAMEDPGVIGPVVWNTYCKKLKHVGASTEEKLDDFKIQHNTSRMRKRFHDLLDETFSLFGSRRESPVEEGRPISYEVKSHSALTNRPAEETQVNLRPRPKTSGPRRALPQNEPPRGAWATNTPSPLSRPLSAGPFRRSSATPEVDIDRVLAEGNLAPNDPAVPLIAAIKTELGKCSLPGSTTNLAE